MLTVTSPLLIGLGAAILTSVLCVPIRSLARTYGFVNRPSGDRWSREPIPLLGGVAIAAGVAISSAIFGERGLVTTALLGSGAGALVLGLADDRLNLGPTAKLVGSLVLGAMLVYLLNRFGPHPLPAPLVLVAILWFAGVVHAVNIVDNMDGLAGGVGAISALALGVILNHGSSTGAAALMFGLAGALVGFLWWNLHPARLFMGDAGSLFLGALVAGGSLVPLFRSDRNVFEPVATAVALSVFVGEAVFVLVVRAMAGRKPTLGGVDHTSHRLIALGFPARLTILILYAMAVAAGIVAVTLARSDSAALPALAVFVIVAALGAVYLAHVPTYHGEDFTALQRLPFGSAIRSALARSHAPQVLLDLLLVAACYYSAYRIRFDGESLDVFLPSFTASLPIVVVCKLLAHYASGLYRRSWLTFGLSDLSAVLRAIAAGTTAVVLAATYLYRFERFSRGVFIIDALLLLLAVIASRLSFRLIAHAVVLQSSRATRVLIIGAGERGQLIAREMLANTAWLLKPVGFLDGAEPSTHSIMGIRVLGALDRLNDVIERLRVEQVICSGDPVEPGALQNALRLCAARSVPVRELVFEIREPAMTASGGTP